MHKSKSNIKRSTVILDNNMVREHNRAMECLSASGKGQSPDTTTPRSTSQNSLDSLRSMESVLSLDHSIMELLEDDGKIHGQEENEVIFFSTNNLVNGKDSDWSLWETDSQMLTRTVLEF